MKLISPPAVSWSNGAIMIAVFAVVCVVLVSTVLLLVLGNNKKK
ncbi:hypothetical protein [Tenacibaculum geojense]|uniref:Uncharacterized protein n=1 Tax=Tenacibaculum geojense TaxID=915352 RepID=A0ABW3JUG4_9FLAO